MLRCYISSRSTFLQRGLWMADSIVKGWTAISQAGQQV